MIKKLICFLTGHRWHAYEIYRWHYHRKCLRCHQCEMVILHQAYGSVLWPSK